MGAWGRLRLRDLLFSQEETLLYSQLHLCQLKQPRESSAKGGGSAKGLWECSTHRAKFLLTFQAGTGMCHSHQLSQARGWKSRLTLAQSPRHIGKRHHDGWIITSSTKAPALPEITATRFLQPIQPRASHGVLWISEQCFRHTSPHLTGVQHHRPQECSDGGVAHCPRYLPSAVSAAWGLWDLRRQHNPVVMQRKNPRPHPCTGRAALIARPEV